MDKVSEKGIETNKSFWNFVKPFMTKVMVASNDITLVEGKKIFTDEYEVWQTFNKRYIKPNKIDITLGSLNDSDVIDRIIKSY